MCTTAFALIRFRNTISLKPHLKNNNIGLFWVVLFFLGTLDIILADGEIKLVTEYKYKAKGPQFCLVAYTGSQDSVCGFLNL